MTRCKTQATDVTDGLRTEIFFVIDGARLEAQACLLAPSLKAHLQPGQSATAYVRQDYRGALTPLTLEMLAKCGVALREIPDTGDGHRPWASPYPHGNKILAAAAPRDCDISVFLDTDMLMAQPVDFAAHLGDGLIGACVSDYSASAGTDEDWAAYYAAFDLPPPSERVQFNLGRKLISYPYFNAGLVAFRERDANGTRPEVGPAWRDAALRFERSVSRPYERANIDQFTLPILGYLLGQPVKALPQHLNFNIQGFGEGAGMEQSIAHYHRIGVLWAHPRHGRVALEGMIKEIGPSAAERFLEAFGAHAKRKRMKVHLRALEAAPAPGSAAAAAPRSGPDPQKKREE